MPKTGGTFSGGIVATSFALSGGTSSQFLKANGSTDSNTYVTSSTLSNYMSKDGGTMYSGDHYLELKATGIELGHIEGSARLALTSVDRYLGITAKGMSCNCAIDATAFNTTSDERLKNIVSEIILSSEQIASAPAIKFRWQNGYGDDKVHVGTTAQYWNKILSEVVESVESRLTLDYSAAAMVSVISLAKEVVELKKEIERLKSQS